MRPICAALALLLAGTAAADTKTITIFEKRSIEYAAPAGWAMASSRHPTGAQTVTLTTSGLRVDVSFFPDPENRFATKEALEELMRKAFGHQLAGAVQKEMTIVHSETAGGLMGQTVFTDKTLAGRPVPPNEFLHATLGIRHWPGVFANFTILSNDLESAEYKQALEFVKSGVRQWKGAE